MTGITSSWMSTVAPPFNSASTTCSWPSWHAYIIAVQPFWSGSITTGAHSDEEHELIPTGSKTVARCSMKICTTESPCYFHQQLRVTVSNHSDYNDFKNKTSHTMEAESTYWVCGGGPTVKWWLVLPLFECPQWPLPLVVPPPHAHDPPDMQTSLLSSHPGVGQQQELT